MDSSLSSLPSHAASPRILIVRLSAHGDVMHTLPLLSAIKRQYPGARVGWLIEASAVGLLEGHPLIDCLHVSHRKRWLRQLRNPLQWRAVWREFQSLLRELRAMDYAMSFDVQGLLKSAVWPFLVRVPKRYGFKATREGAAVLYTHQLPPMRIRDSKPFAAERYLDFARAIGCEVSELVFQIPPVSDEVQRSIDSWLDENAKPLVVLAPFTRWPSKHWEMASWPILIAKLLELDVRLVILGAASDHAKAEVILASFELQQVSGDIINMVGLTNWPDLYALFKRTRLVIGLDSAPLHIANAVGVPRIIGLYGPTAPGRTGPIGAQHATMATALSCQPCFAHECPIKTHDCMRQLQPDMVAAMAKRMLAEPASSMPGSLP